MNAATLESQITVALGRDRAPIDRSGGRSEAEQKNDRSAWEKDYGSRGRQVEKACVDAAGLSLVSGGSGDGSSGPIRKDRLDSRHSWPGQALWREMMSALCPGTRNFFIAAGVVAFIAVL